MSESTITEVSTTSGQLAVSPGLPEGRDMVRVWWLHPAAIFTLVSAGTMIPAVLLSARAYALYGTPKYLDVGSAGIGVMACLAMAAGAWMGTATGKAPSKLSGRGRAALLPWFYLALGLTVFGYLAWAGNAVRAGFRLDTLRELLAATDATAVEKMKTEYFKTIPGVTTCTQFGLVVIVLGCILRTRDSRWVKPLTGFVVMLAAVRMLVNSERLAIVELAVPIGVLWMRLRVLIQPLSSIARARWAVAPLAGVILLFVLMGTSEYFRSWNYYRHQFDSIADFTLWRLSGYYSTAHNNGAMRLRYQGSYPAPYHVLEWFWKFPLVKQSPFAYDEVTGMEPEDFNELMLERWANIELNSPGGLFCAVLDLGMVGAPIFWLGYGFVTARLYRGFMAGSLAGLTFYPIVFVSFLEIPRFIYITTSRIFAPLMLLFLIMYVLRRRTDAGEILEETPASVGMAGQLACATPGS